MVLRPQRKRDPKRVRSSEIFDLRKRVPFNGHYCTSWPSCRAMDGPETRGEGHEEFTQVINLVFPSERAKGSINIIYTAVSDLLKRLDPILFFSYVVMDSECIIMGVWKLYIKRRRHIFCST